MLQLNASGGMKLVIFSLARHYRSLHRRELVHQDCDCHLRSNPKIPCLSMILVFQLILRLLFLLEVQLLTKRPQIFSFLSPHSFIAFCLKNVWPCAVCFLQGGRIPVRTARRCPRNLVRTLETEKATFPHEKERGRYAGLEGRT
jgi:hypothetical protein